MAAMNQTAPGISMATQAVSDARPGSARLALAALIFGACAIAFAPILVRLTQTGPAAAGFWRLVFALPLLVLPLARAPSQALAGGAWKWGLGAGVLFAADLAAWHYGVTFTSVTNATVLPNLTPVVVTAAGWVLFRERPTRGFLIALTLAIGGAITMALAKGSGGHGTHPVLGDALSLLTALFYGLYFVIIRLGRKAASTSALMVWSTLSGAPLMLLASLGLHEQVLPQALSGLLACLGLGVIHVCGQGAIAWALGRLPAATTSVVMLVQPVAAAALAFFIFGERIVPLQAVGAVVVLTGVVLAQRGLARQVRADAKETPQ